MSYLTKKRVLIIKAEVSPGVAVSCNAEDYNIRFEEAKFTPKLSFDSTKKVTTPDYGEYEDVPGDQSGEITASFKLCPGVDTNVPANITKALKLAGLVGSEVSSTGYKWLDIPDGDEQTYSAYLLDVSSAGTPVGVVQTLNGCIADFDIEAAGVGKPIIVTIKMTGKIGQVADFDNASMVALATMTLPDTSAAYIFQGATVSATEGTFKCSKFKLEGGRTIQPQINTADTTGFDFFSIVDRKPKLYINPLKNTASAYEAITQAKTGSGTKIVIDITGSTQPFKITVPNAQLLNPKETEREGRLAWDLEFKCMRNGYEGQLADSTMPVGCLFRLLQGEL